jgi:hypothetical protein
MIFKHLALAFAITASICGLAQADNTYKTTAYLKTDFQTQEWNGGKVTVGSLKGVIETHGSKVSGIPNGESVQNCLVRVVRMGESTDVVANCSFADKDGDIRYGLSERKQGDLKVGGSGKTRFLGGTGKYKGVTGSCEYSSKYLPENWLVVESTCIKDE